ncbi:MAG: hypothetical protein K0R84_2622 [Clostridia bacterium]|nr:hypothetical protein [Clostridia bacterium]
MNNIRYEKPTNKTFQEAVESITKSLAEQNFGVLWKLNFKDKLQEKGIDFDTDFMILEVCNPKQAAEVLSSHIDVGYFLPCKVVVYQTKAGVVIGTMNTEMLIGMLGYEDLSPVAANVQQILRTAIDNAL